MAVATEEYAAWLEQAGIPLQRRTPQLDVLLKAVFRFRQRQGNDYYSTRLLSHFLLHCDCGLKVAQIARLVGIARPTASRQQGMSSKARHPAGPPPHGRPLPRQTPATLRRPDRRIPSGPSQGQPGRPDRVRRANLRRARLRIALYKFLKKYGLNNVAGPAQPPGPANIAVGMLTGPPLESPDAAARPLGRSTVPPLGLPNDPPPAPTIAPASAAQPVPPPAPTPIVTPTPVIELARAVDPRQPSAAPFSSGERNTPGPSC